MIQMGSITGAAAIAGGDGVGGNHQQQQVTSSGRQARVLYDYDASDSTELSLLADEVSPVVMPPRSWCTNIALAVECC